MGIVIAQPPLSIGTNQDEGIIDPVRTSDIRGNSLCSDLGNKPASHVKGLFIQL